MRKTIKKTDKAEWTLILVDLYKIGKEVENFKFYPFPAFEVTKILDDNEDVWFVSLYWLFGEICIEKTIFKNKMRNNNVYE